MRPAPVAPAARAWFRMKRPDISDDHVSSTLAPSGVTRPRPVMTGIDGTRTLLEKEPRPYGRGYDDDILLQRCSRGERDRRHTPHYFPLVQNRDAVLAGV